MGGCGVRVVLECAHAPFQRAVERDRWNRSKAVLAVNEAAMKAAREAAAKREADMAKRRGPARYAAMLAVTERADREARELAERRRAIKVLARFEVGSGGGRGSGDIDSDIAAIASSACKRALADTMAVVVDREKLDVSVCVLMGMDATGAALRTLANREY